MHHIKIHNKTPSEISTNHHNNMANHFDRNYDHYTADKFYNDFTYGRSKIDKELIKIIKTLPENSKALDLGCGTGDQLKILKEHNLDFFGVDSAPSMIDIARKRIGSIERVKHGYAQKIPFNDNTFDFLIMIEVLRYFDLKDIEKSIKEAKRVLRPGGKIFCTFVNKWSLDFFYVYQNLRKILKSKKYDEKNPFCEFFVPDEVINLYKRNDFNNIEVIGNMFSPLRIAYKVNRKFGKYIATKLDNFDDKISNKKFFKPFSGHLIGVGELN